MIRDDDDENVATDRLLVDNDSDECSSSIEKLASLFRTDIPGGDRRSSFHRDLAHSSFHRDLLQASFSRDLSVIRDGEKKNVATDRLLVDNDSDKCGSSSKQLTSHFQTDIPGGGRRSSFHRDLFESSFHRDLLQASFSRDLSTVRDNDNKNVATDRLLVDNDSDECGISSENLLDGKDNGETITTEKLLLVERSDSDDSCNVMVTVPVTSSKAKNSNNDNNEAREKFFLELNAAKEVPSQESYDNDETITTEKLLLVERSNSDDEYGGSFSDNSKKLQHEEYLPKINGVEAVDPEVTTGTITTNSVTTTSIQKSTSSSKSELSIISFSSSSSSSSSSEEGGTITAVSSLAFPIINSANQILVRRYERRARSIKISMNRKRLLHNKSSSSLVLSPLTLTLMKSSSSSSTSSPQSPTPYLAASSSTPIATTVLLVDKLLFDVRVRVRTDVRVRILKAMMIKYYQLRCVQLLNKSKTQYNKSNLVSECINLDENKDNGSIGENERTLQTEAPTSTAKTRPTDAPTSFVFESSPSTSLALKLNIFDPNIRTEALRHLPPESTKKSPSFSNKPSRPTIALTSNSTSLPSFFPERNFRTKVLHHPPPEVKKRLPEFRSKPSRPTITSTLNSRRASTLKSKRKGKKSILYKMKSRTSKLIGGSVKWVSLR